jgi:hypothetical protein
LWIAEKHRAATHDRIATQRILSVPTHRRVIEAVEKRARRHAPRPHVRSALSRRLNAADSLPKERRRTAVLIHRTFRFPFSRNTFSQLRQSGLESIENMFIGVKKP